jgi:hypothetical protein
VNGTAYPDPDGYPFGFGLQERVNQKEKQDGRHACDQKKPKQPFSSLKTNLVTDGMAPAGFHHPDSFRQVSFPPKKVEQSKQTKLPVVPFVTREERETSVGKPIETALENMLQ